MYYTRNRNPFWSIIAYIILYLCILSDTNMNSKPLRCIAWNSRGMNAAKPYLNTLLKDNDIVVISEHQLFHEEIYKLKEICDVSDFQVYVKAKPKPILTVILEMNLAEGHGVKHAVMVENSSSLLIRMTLLLKICIIQVLGQHFHFKIHVVVHPI